MLVVAEGATAATPWWVLAGALAVAYAGFLLVWPDRTLGWVQFGVALGASALLIGLGDGGWQYLGVLIALIAVVSMTARQCAKTTMRVITALTVLLGVLLVARVGTTEVEQDALAAAEAEFGTDPAGRFAELCPPGTPAASCLVAVREQQLAEAELVVVETTALERAKITEELNTALEAVSAAEGSNRVRAEVEDARAVLDRARRRVTTSVALAEKLDVADEALARAVERDTASEIRRDAVAALAAATDAVDVEKATTAAKAAETALDKAKKQQGAGEPAIELVTAGADAIVDAWVSPITSGDGVEVPATLGALAWVLLLVTGVLAYRRLELRNNQSYGAPVQFSSLKTDGDGLTADFLLEGTKARYGSTDLIEPPDTPGGSAFESMQTTLTEAAGDKGKLAAAIAKFAQATAFPKAGITVTGAVTYDDPAPAATVTAAAAPTLPPGSDKGNKAANDDEKPLLGVFRLETTHEHRFIRTERIRAESQAELMDKAAALVASDVFGYSYWTPPWARAWGKQGQALATYRRMVFNPPEDADERLRRLKTALGVAPGNGMIRLMLAHELDLAGEPVEALRLNLQNRIDHPHFLAGRYRLVTSLCMLSDPTVLQQHWWSASATPARAEVLRLVDAGGLLEEALAFHGRPWWHPARWRKEARSDRSVSSAAKARGSMASPSPLTQQQAHVSQVLLWWALHEAKEIERALRPWHLLARALPQQERNAWLAILRSNRRWRRERDQINSLQPIISARRHQADLRMSPQQQLSAADLDRIDRLASPLEKLLSDRRAGTAALYNAACFWSVVAGMIDDNDASPVTQVEQAEQPEPGDPAQSIEEQTAIVRQKAHQAQSVMMTAAAAVRFAELVFVAAMKRLRARFATDSEQTATEGTDHPGSEGRWNAAALMGAWLASKDRIGKRIRLEESTSAAEGAARSARSTAKNRWLDLGLVALEAALRSPHGSRPALKWIEQDPDLAALRSTPGWRHVKARLEEESP